MFVLKQFSMQNTRKCMLQNKLIALLICFEKFLHSFVNESFCLLLQAEKINTLLKAANVNVESIWPSKPVRIFGSFKLLHRGSLYEDNNSYYIFY